MKSSLEPAVRGNARSRIVARILVVDDEPHVRAMIGATLERQGYEVQLAASGREAIEKLELNVFDLVLTDIVMQDGNGIALLERMHAQQPNLPVVMVTAIHDISVAIDSMRRGAYDYLLKPFEREHLITTVERALEHRQALAGEPELPAESGTGGARPNRDAAPGDGRSRALLRRNPRGAGRRARSEGLRDRGPLQARDRLHHRAGACHGHQPDRDQDHRPRRFPARHRQDGDSRRDSPQARQAHR